jgi:hypothetical protein
MQPVSGFISRRQPATLAYGPDQIGQATIGAVSARIRLQSRRMSVRGLRRSLQALSTAAVVHIK